MLLFDLYHKPLKLQFMNNAARKYLAGIGRKGGLKSRRTLSPEAARAMVKVREARRAYARFHAQCFWSYKKDLVISAADIPWVADQLMKHGNRQAWLVGAALCR